MYITVINRPINLTLFHSSLGSRVPKSHKNGWTWHGKQHFSICVFLLGRTLWSSVWPDCSRNFIAKKFWPYLHRCCTIFFNKVTSSAVLVTTSFCSAFVAILLTPEKLGGNFQSNNTVRCTKLHVLVQNLLLFGLFRCSFVIFCTLLLKVRCCEKYLIHQARNCADNFLYSFNYS